MLGLTYGAVAELCEGHCAPIRSVNAEVGVAEIRARIRASPGDTLIGSSQIELILVYSSRSNRYLHAALYDEGGGIELILVYSSRSQ